MFVFTMRMSNVNFLFIFQAMQLKNFGEMFRTSQAVILMFSVIDKQSFVKIQQLAEEYVETIKHNKK